MAMNPTNVTISLIANVLKLTVPDALALSNFPKHRYFPTRAVRKKNKTREFRTPRPPFMAQLRLLQAWFQECKFAHERAYGGIKGRDNLRHALKHCGREFVWKIDVEDCFPSVGPHALKRQLKRRGFRSDVARFLTGILTVDEQLPQGSPTSNAALDFLMYELDEQLLIFGKANRFFTGRYADDIIVSGDDKQIGEQAIEIIKTNLTVLALRPNRIKEEDSGFRPKSKPQDVHGTLVNSPFGVGISPRMRENYIALADNYVAACRSVQPGNVAIVWAKRRTLIGKIGYAGRLRASKVRHLRQRLRLGDRIFRDRVALFGGIDETQKVIPEGETCVYARKGSPPG
jgi:hypothetical protein